MNPYKELGVERDADQATIKRAYRRRAQKAHPDREGGSVEAMQRASRALAILEDPRARAKFDSTGTVEEEKDEAMRISALLAQLFLTVVTSIDFTKDPLSIMRSEIEMKRAQSEAQKRDMISRENKLLAVAERISCNGPANIIRLKIEAAVRDQHAQIHIADENIEIATLMLEMLKTYSFKIDEPAEGKEWR